jgi:phosphoglycolate phosphatase-like HAD superfamily hydrolase
MKYGDGTRIELRAPRASLQLGRVSHALFDHDGTISVLRQGWEQVMAPVMVRAILGDRHEDADEPLRRKVRARVAEYIDRSTGIQTIVQMDALAGMVREFGIVSPDRILDYKGYKALYDRELMEVVNRRVGRFRAGELSAEDLTIKGAVPFLAALRERGVRLYLASGTDDGDVRAEAGLLGYAGLFDGGMYGCVGDLSRSSKRMVIERIFREHGLSGPELVCFGDGPVEMQECRRCEGIAVGIASDEVRRSGLNEAKRARLIRAGAHIIAPDFSQGEELLGLLFAR